MKMIKTFVGSINWRVRFKNPIVIGQVLLAVVAPVGAYFGISASDITSWAILWHVFVQAISNPYVLATIVVGLWNALVVDPTTPGVRDSIQALNRNSVKESK